MKPVRDKAAEKRDRILAAARHLFLRQGLRATSMEAIARAAGMAKPTLYSQFADKDAVFLALLEQLLADKAAAFEAALAADGSITERVGAAVAAEFAVVAALLEGSPHADELFASHGRGYAIVAKAEAEVSRRLVALLQEAGLHAADQLVRILLAAAFGLAQKAASPQQLAEEIEFLAARLLR